MVYRWEPWTAYGPEAVVDYDGELWRIVQPHTSQPDWAPPVVPALWSRLPQEEHDDYRSGRRHHGVEEDHLGAQKSHGQDCPQPGGWGHDEHRGERHERPGGAPHGKEEDNWLTEKRKHALEIGGGIVGAVAIGAGIYAWSEHHNKAQEEAKKQAWQSQASQQGWEQGALARTDHYNSGGQGPPVRWVLTEAGRGFPQDAVAGGREHGTPLYIARAFHAGGLHVGKAAPHLNNGRGGCSIAFDGQEITHLNKFEVLCGSDHACKWINHDGGRGPLVVQQGTQPVEGGREADGRFIAVVQCRYEGGVHPGKYTMGERYACISFGGEEVRCNEFNFLCYS